MRRWRDSDVPALASLNRDPIVMEFIGPVLSTAESQAMIARAEKSWDSLGYGRFAVEVIKTHDLIGFIGLAQCKFESHFTPAIEVGWRLAHRFWNLGYATEGATAVMSWAFDTLELGEVVSFTSASNFRSRRVMEKLSMEQNVLDDFDHPNMVPGNPLRMNVLYRKQKPH